jgi:D-alanyl-D-alanine carboxypeptidase
MKWSQILCSTELAGASLVASAICCGAVASDNQYGTAPSNMDNHLRRLMAVYPTAVDRFDSQFVYLKNGTRYLISDGNTHKTFSELLAIPDIDDTFYANYPAGEPPTAPGKKVDPGRVRFTPLFVAMYGDCKKGEVDNRLRTIKWLPRHGGQSVRVTRVNGVDRALEAISEGIDQLALDLVAYAFPVAGTYKCRAVAGTNTRSMHGYGAAIDLNVKRSDYWRWQGPLAPVWRNRMPYEIVNIFEKHGFIWGGRWYHYDTMHFEYRPELIDSIGQ